MRKNLIYFVTVPYVIIALIVIFSRIFKIPELENALRPLLLFILILWYIIGTSTYKSKTNWVFIFALFLSLLGDIYRIPLINNFILGLFFFLSSLLLYSAVFLWESKGRIIDILLESWLFLLIIFLILSSVLIGLLPPLIRNNLYVYLTALPMLILIVYILVASTNVYSQVYYDIFGKYVMLGGLFFLFSGIILAVNRFSIDVKLSSAWVLSTYVIAQWMLVYGYMNSKRADKNF